jgi:predicted phage terminase large subunit-like protein
VVGQAWGLKGADAYLLDQVREQMEFTETLKAVVRLRKKWAAWPKLLRDQGTVISTLIENKANGPAIISSLRHEVPGILPWPPKGTRMESKEARLQAITPAIESGNVYLPLGAHFSRSLIDEAKDFPNGAHDDQLDAMSQALTKLLPGMWNPAEKQEPPPADLYEMRAREMRAKLAEYTKPADETIPTRYGILNS